MKLKKNANGYYRASFNAGKKPDGKENRIVVWGKTEKECKEKYEQARQLYGKGIELGSTTVREWSERWLSVYKANATVTQKAHYEAKLENDILPKIGCMAIREVRKSHLQELLNSYKGGKKGTVSKIKVALQQLFDDAEAEGLVERSPAYKLEMPDIEEKARRPLTSIERAVVIKVAETHPQGLYVLTMLYCGLRRGECIALTVEDVDLEKKKIYVNKSLSLRKNVGIEKTTKSKAGLREVPIPEVLYFRIFTYLQNRDKCDILFPKADGKHATKQTCTWWWKSFLRQCHITSGAKLYRNQVQIETSKVSDDLSPHYLRHTYATDLYAAGVDEKARKSFLGHSSTDVTDIYTKMSDEAFGRAAKQINEYLVTLSRDNYGILGTRDNAK